MELEPTGPGRSRINARGRVQMLRNGYQSWSACDVGDPIEAESHLLTMLRDDDGQVVIGADGGDQHDTVFRVEGDELVVDRDGAAHDVAIHDSLDAWARAAAAHADARATAPYQVGWCSWYQYFHGVTEAHVRHNLALAGDWPIDVFQVDDGFQAAIGDWLLRQPAFPTPLERLAGDIEAAGFVPGLWIAPFLAHPASQVAQDHPDWMVVHPSGKPLVGSVNPPWGGRVGVLDTTHPEVLAHLEELARTLVAMGWRYLKLDFTYAPSLDGLWHDASRTPAQRVRAGFDAVRRGAGDDTFLLGCGAPLGATIGVVDGMRIGPDVAPFWEPRQAGNDMAPSTANALRNTEARQFMHRRLWLNDPDCLMLRTDDTELTAEQVTRWAYAVGDSGGMALVSDDLALLGADARSLLDEVLSRGQTADRLAARA